MEDKLVIGSVEWVALPDLNIPAIKVRVDSGAKTSALHAVNIKTFERNNNTWVSFDVHPIADNNIKTIQCEAQVIDTREVKSSTGNIENRFVIKSTLTLNNESWEIEITLANRDSMGYRMLLGREAMRGKMLVDPEINFMLGRITKESINKFYN